MKCKWDATEVGGSDAVNLSGAVHSFETIDATAKYDYLFVVHSDAL